jgi:hypothetical protein
MHCLPAALPAGGKVTKNTLYIVIALLVCATLAFGVNAITSMVAHDTQVNAQNEQRHPHSWLLGGLLSGLKPAGNGRNPGTGRMDRPERVAAQQAYRCAGKGDLLMRECS